MAKAAPHWPQLDAALLASDEEEYDRIAVETVSQLSKITDLDNQELDQLDPSHQLIPFVFILSAHIDASIKSGKAPGRQLPVSVLPEGRLWPFMTKLLNTFDYVQVRYAGHQFARIIETVARGAEQTQDYVPAIQLLETAILRLDPFSSTLTTTHLYYIRLSLLAGAYANAIQILERPIYALPSSDITKQIGNRAFKHLCSVHESSSSYITPVTGLTQKITSRMYMEYFLMGAMCYLGAEHYREALIFLEVVLTTPALQNAVSVVQLDAYKKWLLLNLLVHGEDEKLPASISQYAGRNLRAAAKPYQCVVDAFKSNKIERLQAEIQEGMQLWQEDENYGLMHEVFAAFRKYSVKKLGKVYAAASMREVCRLTSPDPNDVQGTVAYVVALIESGALQATLVPASDGGVLRFSADIEYSVPEAQIEQEMASRARELKQLLRNISNLDHNMAIHKDYIEQLHKLRIARDREKKTNGSNSRSTIMDMHDEDMMDDL